MVGNNIFLQIFPRSWLSLTPITNISKKVSKYWRNINYINKTAMPPNSGVNWKVDEPCHLGIEKQHSLQQRAIMLLMGYLPTRSAWNVKPKTMCHAYICHHWYVRGCLNTQQGLLKLNGWANTQSKALSLFLCYWQIIWISTLDLIQFMWHSGSLYAQVNLGFLPWRSSLIRCLSSDDIIQYSSKGAMLTQPWVSHKLGHAVREVQSGV